MNGDCDCNECQEEICVITEKLEKGFYSAEIPGFLHMGFGHDRRTAANDVMRYWYAAMASLN